MSLQVRNSRELLDPQKLRLKLLLVGVHGWGKTRWGCTVPDAGWIVRDDGHGNGLLTIAAAGVDYVVPETMAELTEAVSGRPFPGKSALVFDSASVAAHTLVQADALSIKERKSGDSGKRMRGVPERDDYGVMGEVTRRTLARLLDNDKHIVVTAHLRIKEPNEEHPSDPTFIGPDFPGQLMLGASGMFDLVLIGQIRNRVTKVNGVETRVSERYFLTQPTGNYLAKSRLSVSDKHVLPPQVTVNYETGEGTFPWILEAARAAYGAPAA